MKKTISILSFSKWSFALALLFCAQGALAMQVHQYNLDQDYSDQMGGPDLVPEGGMLTGSNYHLMENQGLTLSNSNLATLEEYTIDMRFRLDPKIEWVKLIDYSNGQVDPGVYQHPDGGIQFFPYLESAPLNALKSGRFINLTVTREAVSKRIALYIDGVEQLAITDDSNDGVASTPEGIFRFFQDDVSSNLSEATPGDVDYIRIFDQALSSTEVASLGPCLGEVKIENTRVTVSPNGSDDTGNLQCALHVAQARGIPMVLMTAGEFYISRLDIADFDGAFQGTRKADTIVNILDDSIDCDALITSGRAPSALRFNGGQPEVRTMTLRANHPCMTERFLESLILFTGEPADAECGFDVIFALADRLSIEGSGIFSGVATGIGAWAEGHFLETCRNALNGSLKVNRVDIRSVDVGVRTSMQSGAQVDVNNSTFEDTIIGYDMQRSNQITSLTSNTFTGIAVDTRNYWAVIATAGDSPPDRSRLTLQNNIFNLSGPMSYPAIGFISYYAGSSAQLSFLARDNIFNMADDAWAIAGFDISNGVISNNILRGSGNAGLFISGQASDWAIMGNTFVGYTGILDILLDSSTSNCVVGPNQTMNVDDQGTNNTVIGN